MVDFDRLTEELKSDEGFVSHAYRDHLGFWTIGFGRLIDERRGGGISKAEASRLLESDIHRVYHSLRNSISFFDNLPEPTQRALCNMGFQLGTNGVLRFKRMLTALKQGNHERAYIEALDSKWARQTPERAMRVANLIRNK